MTLRRHRLKTPLLRLPKPERLTIKTDEKIPGKLQMSGIFLRAVTSAARWTGGFSRRCGRNRFISRASGRYLITARGVWTTIHAETPTFLAGPC
jgi:hypothetical protein